MATVSYASSKGGVGKTTSALLLAGELVNAGSQVAIIDADPNRPLQRWADLGRVPEEIHLISEVDERNILDIVDEMERRYPFVLIDLEGSANMLVSYAISRSDLVIIPLQGSQLDLNEAGKAIGLVRRQEQAFRRSIPYRVLLTRTSAAIRPATLRHIEAELDRNEIPTFRTMLFERDAFRAPFSFGGTLRNLPDGSVRRPDAAYENAEAYAQEVVDVLKSASNQGEAA